MDVLARQSRQTQIVIGGGLLYVLLSFFHWQSYDSVIGTFSRSEWTGIGVIAALLAIAVVAWEAVRAFQIKLELGGLSPGLVSLGLAALLLVFTVITFLSHNELRKWPAWAGLVLSIAIAVAAWLRAQAEGVQMPDVSAMRTSPAATTEPPPSSPPPAAPPSGQDPPAV